MKHPVWESECGRKWKQGEIEQQIWKENDKDISYSHGNETKRGKINKASSNKSLMVWKYQAWRKKVQREIHMHIVDSYFIIYICYQNTDLKKKEKPLLFLPTRESYY